jgi:SAM-dependent methyltransferase
MSQDPTAPTTWDEVASSTDGLPAGWRRHGREVHLALVRRWIGEPQGRWLKTDLFEERSHDRALLPLGGAAWVGIDLSGEVARAGRHVGAAASVADVRRLPFRDGAFDGVLSTSTLDHFADTAHIEASLQELHRILAHDARLVLTLDNAAHPLIRLRNALPDGWRRRTGLVPFFVGATLDEGAGRRMLASVGFEVLDVVHLLHAPHVVGTRPARWDWYANTALPWFDRLANTRLRGRTGHYVAFLARATSPDPDPAVLRS